MSLAQAQPLEHSSVNTAVVSCVHAHYYATAGGPGTIGNQPVNLGGLVWLGSTAVIGLLSCFD